MAKETYRDTGLVTGTHYGKTTLRLLRSQRVDFEVIGSVGRCVTNDTDGSSGIVLLEGPFDITTGWSWIWVILLGGATNRWNAGDDFTLYIGGVPNARISSTEICKKCGFAYPQKILQDGEHPDEKDKPQELFDIRSRRKK